MHQPYYRDAMTGEYSLPWVRLHAANDYAHMAELVAEFPRLHVTFNDVPSLTEQFDAYARGEAVDAWMKVCLKPALTDSDKRFLARYFFSINVERFIKPRRRYHRLLQLRDQLDGDLELLRDRYWL